MINVDDGDDGEDVDEDVEDDVDDDEDDVDDDDTIGGGDIEGGGSVERPKRERKAYSRSNFSRTQETNLMRLSGRACTMSDACRKSICPKSWEETKRMICDALKMQLASEVGSGS